MRERPASQRKALWLAALSLLVVGAGGAGLALARRAGTPPPPTPTGPAPSVFVEAPSTTTPVAPSTTTPGAPGTASPSPLALGCEVSRTRGDFDGDGATDVATVHYVPPEGGCVEDVSAQPLPYRVAVRFGSGATLDVPAGACTWVCQGWGAVDLDRDGRDELALLVEQGASTSFLSFFRVGPDEVAPIPVAPPGAPGFDPGVPAVFPFGGSVVHPDFLTCTEEEGELRVVATSAVLAPDGSRYEVQEVVFRFDGAALVPVRTDRRAVRTAEDGSPRGPLPMGTPCSGLGV